MRYRPDNSSDYIELDSCVSPVVLSDLIPDTSYVIQIVDGQNPQVKGEAFSIPRDGTTATYGCPGILPISGTG